MTEKETELSESLEDYLEIILELEETRRVARAKDIADRMKVRRGSVTGALKTLGERGLLNYEPYNFVTLTREGKRIAREVTRRHRVLNDFLMNVLQIGPEKADLIACRMEHSVDKASIDALVRFIDFVYNCPRAGEDWIQSFVNDCGARGFDQERCENCLDKCRTYHRTKEGSQESAAD